MIQSISGITSTVKGNAVFILTNKYVRSKNEKKLDIYRQTIYFSYIDRLYNKEENPLLAKGLAFSFGKQGGFYVKQIIDSG